MIKRRITKGLALLFVTSMSNLYYAEAISLEGLAITGVSEDNRVISRRGEVSNIKFNINQPAKVYLNIFDARGHLFRQVESAKELDRGDHTLRWDGTDGRGNRARPEAYFYTLSASDSKSEEVIFDLSDQTGGDTVIVENVSYDQENQTVTYTIPKPARVFLRAGIENGFVVRTLVNGAVRLAGTYQEKWDGMDANQVLSLGKHPKLRFFGEGYQLSRNSIVIEDKSNLVRQAEWKSFPSLKERRIGSAKPVGLNRHAYHPVEQCRDVKLRLEFVGKVDKKENGTPIINGAVKLRVAIADEDLMMIEAERSEIVFFLDNQLIYENEVSFYPYTWEWNPKGIKSGQYYLTAFVVGFSEHFGVAMVKVHVSG